MKACSNLYQKKFPNKSFLILEKIIRTNMLRKKFVTITIFGQNVKQEQKFVNIDGNFRKLRRSNFDI